MSITRAQAEFTLVDRCGTIMTAAGLDGTTVSGSNADLNNPLWFGIKRLGYSVSSLVAVADADLVSIGAADEEAFFDLVELRTLENCLNASIALVDITVGPRRESLSQLASRLQSVCDRKKAQILADYGSLVGASLEASSINLNFQEDGTNEY